MLKTTPWVSISHLAALDFPGCVMKCLEGVLAVEVPGALDAGVSTLQN